MKAILRATLSTAVIGGLLVATHGPAFAQTCLATTGTGCTPTQTFACSLTPGGSACSAEPYTISSPQVYIVFWGWTHCSDSNCSLDGGTVSQDPNNTRTAVESLFSTYEQAGLGYSRYFWQLQQWTGTEYGYGSGTASVTPQENILGGVWYDSTPLVVPDGGISNTVEWTEVQRAAAHFGVSNNQNDIFILMRPPGSPEQPNICAYHNSVQDSFGYPFVYADVNFDPWGYGTNCYSCSNGACGIESTVMHELYEAIANPDQKNGNCGWKVTYATGVEIADNCQTINNTPLAVGLQSGSTQYVISTTSDRAYSSSAGCGQCSFARIPFADAFITGGSPYNLWHMEVSADQSVSSGTWVNWGNMGAPGYALYGGSGSTSWAPGRTDVFARVTDGTLRHDYVDSTNSNCLGPDTPVCNDSMGAPPTGWAMQNGDPGVASWGPGHQDVFVNANYYGTNYILSITYDNYAILSGSYSGHWSYWSPPSGVSFSDGLAVVEYKPGVVDLFGRAGNTIWHGVLNVTNGNTPGGSLTWTEWVGQEYYNGAALNWTGRIQAAEWLPGHFDVFALDGNTNQGWIWDCGNGGPCYAWQPPSGIHFAGAPGVARLGDNRLLVSGRDSTSSQNMWMQLYDWGRSTGGWLNEGGYIASQGAGMSSW